tara:strand:- start:232 stop:615 length:384 start_codon:yes stop_codon:yes gene_type:complete
LNLQVTSRQNKKGVEEDGLDSLWDKIKRSVIDSANVAAEKAEYLGKIGRARLDIAKTRHAIRDRFADLGGLVYEGLKSDDGSDIAGSDEVKGLVSVISDLEQELGRREEALNTLREEAGEAEEVDTE